tara:strand:+ start:6357 stop:6851 length:495 start_codon:yes stop_codon:yes gene_type:complete
MATNLSANLEKLNYGAPNGCVATGLHREVLTALGTTYVLSQEESGALVVCDQAATQTITLPTPQVGMNFEFFWAIQRTGTHKIITNAATVFLVGSVMAGDAAIATSGDVFEADGSTIVAYTADGDTKGGFIGSRITFTAISTTKWAVRGIVIGTGTMATGFATS